MKLTVCTALFVISSTFAQASTVKIDWRGGSFYLATTDITSISSNYSAWPDKSLGLWVGTEYEVLVLGDHGFEPDQVPEYSTGGFIASNDPGVRQQSVREEIRRIDGKPFTLSALDTQIGLADGFAGYLYDYPDGSFGTTYVQLTSFEVTVDTNKGMATVDPYSHVYHLDPFSSGIIQERALKVTSDFGGIGDAVDYVSISSRFIQPSICEPEALLQTSAQFQAAAVVPCSVQSTDDNQFFFADGPDGGMASAGITYDHYAKNYLWTFSYAPTLTSASVNAIPLPGALGMSLLSFGGLWLFRRRG